MNFNPFTIIFGVEPKSYIPRNAEFQRITTDFESISPVSPGYAIVGTRGCGKTVLMTSIQNYFSENKSWLVLRLNPDLDLFSSAISQLSEFIHLKEEMVTGISVSAAGFGGSVETRSLSDNETLLRKMLKEARKRGKRVLIAIDEASNTGNIKTFAHSYQAFLGEKLPVFLLLTSLPENFNALSNSKNGTFLRRLPKIRLEGLSELMIEEKYREIFSIPSETAIRMAKVVQGYPYAFQLLGSLLWEENKKSVDDDILSKLDMLLYDGAYIAIWNHLTEKERSVMCAIAHSKTGTVKEIRSILQMETNQFSPYREVLKTDGLINTNSYGKISFSLPRFKEFIIKIEQYMLPDE